MRAGKVIYQKRRQLRDMDASLSSSLEIGNPFDSSSFSKVTEIRVTTESANATDRIPNLARDSISFRFQKPFKPPYSPYSVTVEAGGGGLEKLSGSPLKQIMISELEASSQRRAKTVSEANSAAWAYTKYAFLFFAALLVTWVSECLVPIFRLS